MNLENTSLTEITEDHQVSRAHLNHRQQVAMAMLLSGRTHRETAHTVGVARETVTRWTTRNPFFRAEMNRRRRDAWAASQERLRVLSDKALDVLDWALSNGNTKVALAFLTRMDKQREPGGATTPEEVIDGMARASAMELFIGQLDTPEQREFQKILREYWMPEREDLPLAPPKLPGTKD